MKEYKDYHYLTKAVTLPNGKRKYIRAKTQRELTRKVTQFLISLEGKAMQEVDEEMTVEDLADLWIEKVKRPSVKPQTLAVYEDRIKCHIIPAIGNMQVCKVRSIHLIDMFNRFGYNTKSGNRGLMTTTRAMFSFAVENDIITKSPAPSRFSPVGVSGKEDRPLTPTQTRSLLDYCKQVDYTLYLFTYLALVTGMRRGELIALRWDCVDLQNGLIKVRRQAISSTEEITDDLKTSAAKRDIPVGEDTVAILRAARVNSQSTYVLSGNVNGHLGTNVVSGYSRVWNQAGVTDAKIHAHLFRKTFATRMIESGTDPKRVQYLLGHTSLDMTLGVYAKYDQESQAEKTRELMSSVFGGLVSNG